ncbi:putative reverse transcriptase domain-containing protein [Tanacetum coccineum]
MAGVDVDTLTMEQYLALSQENQEPGVVKPEIGGNVNFKIKSQFMHKLREDTFSRNKDEDAHDHIDRVLSIVGLFNIPRVSKDVVMLRVFPFTLTRSAKRWVDRLAQELSILGISSKRPLSKGPHLDKDYPFNEEVKQVKEVRYGEFRRTTPFNGNNGGKFHVGLPGYYTKIDNRSLYGKKRQSLEELLAKHQEESTRRSTEMEGLNKLHRVSFISGPESNTSEVLQHQLLPKELNPGSFTLPYTIGKFNFYAMADLGASINVMPRSIFEHLHLINLKKINMLYEMADMSKKAPLGIVENVLVKIDKFLFPSNFLILNNTPSETTILGRPFFATIYAEIDVFAGIISLGINEDRISFDTMRKDHNYTNPSEKIFIVGHTDISEPVKKALLKLWLIDYFQDNSAFVNDPTHRNFDDYKWEFNLEIDKLADEYELGIGKKGHILDSI